MTPRLQRLRKLMNEEKIDGIFISSLPNITYLTEFSDFTIFDRDGFLLITKRNQYIFTHGIYKEAVKKKVKDFSLIVIKRENPINKSLKDIIEKENITLLGFEAFDLKVDEYEKLLKEIDKKILKSTNLINKLRIKKTSEEIKSIKKACALGDKAYAHILNKIRIGVTEKDLAFELEMFIKKHGAELSFPSIVAFGPNASKPHHVPTNAKLKKNRFVLLDFGVTLNNYCSDMTRTIFFGKANEKQKRAYQIVFDSQQKAIQKCNNVTMNQFEIPAKQLDKIARDYIVSQKFPDMPHSLGHGIGLEVHESPRLTPLSHDLLENGNVFSIEPGVYVAGKFGIRIEDIFAIENGKLIQLTTAPSKFVEI